MKQEECQKMVTEDEVKWECPNGHGVISTKIHHVETHTSSHCKNDELDYYY